MVRLCGQSENSHRGRLAFQLVKPPVGESGRARLQGVDGRLGQQNRVARRLRELLYPGGDIDGITDQGEFQLAAATDGAGDHHTGVDPDTDPKRTLESFGNHPLHQQRGVHCGIGMVHKLVGRAEDRQRTIAEELVDMSTGIDHGGHHDLEQRIQPSDGVLSRVRFGVRGEVTNVDEHHRHLAPLTGEHIVTLLKQPRRQERVDVRPECRLKSLPFSQTRLHAVEGGRQCTQVVVLDYRQALTVVAGRNAFGALGQVADRSQERCHRHDRDWPCDELPRGRGHQISHAIDTAFVGNITTNGPSGLQSITPSVVDTGAAITNTDPFVQAVFAAKPVGARLTHWLMAPSTAETLAKIKKAEASNESLIAFDARGELSVLGLPVLTLPSVDEDTLFWGIPSDRVVTVLRKDAKVTRSKDSGFYNDALDVRAITRVGVGFLHEAAVICGYDAV